MRFLYAEYNSLLIIGSALWFYYMYHNSVDITTFNGYILRIDCNVAENGLRTTTCSQCALDALAI